MPEFSVIPIAILIIFAVAVVAVVIFAAISERRYPPTGRFLECEGMRLHYIECGDAAASPVVMFHGNGSMIQDLSLSGLVDRIAQDHRVLCFDRPGFGYSGRLRSQAWTPERQAALFAEALRQLDVRNPVVFGHSWGALVALALALGDGCRPRGLVLASGYYFPTWRPDFWLSSWPALPVLGDIFCFTLGPLLSAAVVPRMLAKLFAPRPVAAEFKAEFPISLAVRPRQLQATAQEMAYLIPAAARLQLRYRQIGCPVFIFHGDKDAVVECRQAERLRQTLSSAHLQIVEECGHMIHYADAPAIARAIDAVAPGVARPSAM